MLTQDELKSVLSYDPETGIFTRISKRRGQPREGSVAGNLTEKGYVRISVLNHRHYAQDLAWLYIYGHIPVEEIDHRDRNKANNRITNLRIAGNSNNQANTSIRKNNKTGCKGVTKKGRKWQAFIKGKYLGSFSQKEKAAEAYASAAKEIFGEFAFIPEQQRCQS
jgi:hypothetical protein